MSASGSIFDISCAYCLINQFRLYLRLHKFIYLFYTFRHGCLVLRPSLSLLIHLCIYLLNLHLFLLKINLKLHLVKIIN